MSRPRFYDETGNADPATEKLFGDLYQALLGELGEKDVFEIEVTMTDADTIRALNAENRGVDSVTDVLSFPAMEDVLPFDGEKHADDADPESGEFILGDIIICYERACEQAREYGHSLTRELCYLFVHGMCHLFGFDHESETQKAQMRAVEEAALGACGITREA